MLPVLALIQGWDIMKRSRIFLAAGLASAALALPMTHAATTTNTMAVSLTVVGTCAVAATPMVFGPSSSDISTALDAEASLQVVCTTGTPWDITLDAGTGAGATHASRKMTNASDNSTVDYSLFTDAGRTTVWDESGGQVTGVGDNTPQNVPVFGQVFAPQTASQGDFTDTIVVTLTF